MEDATPQSESFSDTVTPDSAALTYGIGRDNSVHGTSGPVNVSFQAQFYTASANFYAGLNELGVADAGDTNVGLTAGASFLPLSIDPISKTRSDARRSLYDPVSSRDNLYVSSGQFVTRLNLEGIDQPEAERTVPDSSVGQGSQPGLKLNTIINAFLDNINIFNIFPGNGLEDLFGLFSKARSVLPQGPAQAPPRQRKQKRAASSPLPSIRINGVECATDASSPRRNITARREVILAAGATHTPLILQLSGIGDSTFLSTLDITTAVDLPGVGNNYQDHFMVASNAPFQNSSYAAPKGYGADSAADDANRAAFWNDRAGPWTAGPPNGVAFPSLKSMSEANASAIAAAAGAQARGMHLADGVDASVVAGWEAQRRLLVGALGNANRSQFEILNDNAGHFTYSVMKPFSRGQVRARSRDPFDVPVIDPR